MMKVRVVPKDIFTKCFVNDPCNCVLYQVRIFSTQASHVSIRLLNNDFIDLEVEMFTWQFWNHHANGQKGKNGDFCTGEDD